MATTVKRVTINLTKEDERQLTMLCKYYGENPSQTLQRLILTDFMWKFPNELKGIIPNAEDLDTHSQS